MSIANFVQYLPISIQFENEFSFNNSFSIPDWATEILKSNDTLEYLSAVSYEIPTYLPVMKKIRAGFLIKEMLDRFKDKTLSKLDPDRSLWIYAVHSTGISNVLNSLDLFDLKVVKFH